MGVVSTVMFESVVNSERCKTILYRSRFQNRLRALLIQKDVKRTGIQKKRTKV